MDIIDLIHQLRFELWSYQFMEWKMNLFTTRWWFSAITIVIAYAIWWKYVDKRRLTQILLFGSFIAVFRIIMDDVGASLALWVYSVKLIPLGHALFLNDLTIGPLAFMLVYQYCQSWKKFLLWTVIVEGGYSFVFLPILTHFDLLRLYNWQYHYTFFLMLFAAIVMRAILLTILKIEQKNEFGYSIDPLTAKWQPAMKPLDKENDNPKKD